MKHNKNNGSNVPNLRFPEFTGEWEITTLGNISEYVKDRIMTCSLSPNNYISTENLIQNFQGVVVASSIPLNASVTSYRANDILFSNIRPYLKKTWKANMNGGCSTDVFIFRYNEACLPDFLYYLIANDNFVNYVMTGAKGVKMPRGDKQQIKQYPVCLPTKPEQSQIAIMLSLIDERISTQNKIIEDLKLLKSAMEERIFNNNNWSTYSYSQLLSISNERNRDMQFSNVLSASQELGMIERNDINIDIKYNRDSTRTYKIVRKGDYVLHLRSFQGGLAFAEYDGICSPAYTILRSSKLLHFGFLKFFFNSKKFINSLRIVTYGIRDGRSINADEFLALKIRIPEMNEQQKFTCLFNSINTKIRINKNMASAYTRQKEYLLQNMFI